MYFWSYCIILSVHLKTQLPQTEAMSQVQLICMLCWSRASWVFCLIREQLYSVQASVSSALCSCSNRSMWWRETQWFPQQCRSLQSPQNSYRTQTQSITLIIQLKNIHTESQPSEQHLLMFKKKLPSWMSTQQEPENREHESGKFPKSTDYATN